MRTAYGFSGLSSISHTCLLSLKKKQNTRHWKVSPSTKLSSTISTKHVTSSKNMKMSMGSPSMG